MEPGGRKIKSEILAECTRILKSKINDLSAALNDITESANNETKSSAGDKYETGRAMMQQEHDKIGAQLAELKLQLEELEKLEPEVAGTIRMGSYVETDNGTFYIATAIGKIMVRSKNVFVISPLSPIGKQLLACKTTFFEMNDKKYIIKSII